MTEKTDGSCGRSDPPLASRRKKVLPEPWQRQLNYSMCAGGKRLRPVLLLECCRLFDGDEALAEPFMAGIEMIHTHSLIHDDLPAIDNDDYRRGRLTAHRYMGSHGDPGRGSSFKLWL